MKRSQGISALVLACSLLLPALGAALACTSSPTAGMEAMRCCRTMHSACMRGEHAGAMACCRQAAPATTALWVTAREAHTATPTAMATATVAPKAVTPAAPVTKAPTEPSPPWKMPPLASSAGLRI